MKEAESPLTFIVIFLEVKREQLSLIYTGGTSTVRNYFLVKLYTKDFPLCQGNVGKYMPVTMLKLFSPGNFLYYTEKRISF